jgi:hypothetical protein
VGRFESGTFREGDVLYVHQNLLSNFTKNGTLMKVKLKRKIINTYDIEDLCSTGLKGPLPVK